jgi:hypothetical protein
MKNTLTCFMQDYRLNQGHLTADDVGLRHHPQKESIQQIDSRNSFGSDFVVRDPGFWLGFLIWFFVWRKQNSKIPSRSEDRARRSISDAMSESFMGRRHLL